MVRTQLIFRIAALVTLSASMVEASCNQSINIDPVKRFSQFGFVPGEGFSAASMSCTEAEATMNRFVFENPHFLSLQELEDFDAYKAKIQKMDSAFEAASTSLQSEIDNQSSALWEQGAWVAAGGIVSAVSCIGSWGTLCYAGIVVAAGPTVYTFNEADNSASFELALQQLGSMTAERKELATQAGYTSSKAAYSDFVHGFCAAVRDQCSQ